MAPVQSMVESPGLGSRHLLDKIDKLRELGISKQVPLPQLVVVGDQSSGKSSVLESLTGYYFPRSVGLCTRHATEIVCRREKDTSIVVTIHPVDATPAKIEAAKSFRHVIRDLKGSEFSKVLEEARKILLPASEVMGLKSAEDEASSGTAFSRDILRVEICGPDEEHLTFIDVPAVLTLNKGITTTTDVAMVKSMVKDYIKDSRTIILAVIPCNVDVATQTILTYAAEADPEGKRTLGVLTKPDLALERATVEAVMELVRGKRRDIQLGYYVVKNRGADDTSSSKDDRDLQETVFFSNDPWTKLDKSRLGIPALRDRLRKLLMDRTKSEFPKVTRDINNRLCEAKKQLEAMGQSRSTADEQRAYLGKLASRFSELKAYGLDGYYTGDALFERRPELKLVTRVRQMNDAFSEMFFAKGHCRKFQEYDDEEDIPMPGTSTQENSSPWGSKPQEPTKSESLMSRDDSGDTTITSDDLYPLRFQIPSDENEELENILSDPCRRTEPLTDDVMEHLESLYLTSRGYEIGTFGGQMLPAAFKEQSKKWEGLTLSHVSNVILVVHHFVYEVVKESCIDQQVRDALWSFILEDLTKRYQEAMDHARFLVHVEREGRAMTYNPAFDTVFSSIKTKRTVEKLSDLKVEAYQYGKKNSNSNSEDFVRWRDVTNMSNHTAGIKETCNAIHDLLNSYYQVASARFVDMVCTQAVDHFLLGAGEKSPLGVLSANRIFEMSAEELEMVAGEDSISRSAREMLMNDIQALEEGKKILRI
ncbi:dynamin family protein [Colletotrichum scovillei]|uniref:dynamin family protein n=1 Tax=Colletotrichum scovillei TaxID=1209932 RepID=UPI0015C33E33|nr:dynamin family protein [Colletotrichum scovillei]KAF4778116.1 dynamin family protein [Colletotrichum scovillei]